MSRRFCYARACLATAIVLVAALFSLALPLTPFGNWIVHSPASMGGSSRSGPYCGLYCIYAVARLDGQSVSFESLLTNKYINSIHGSSIDELRLAARDLNLQTLPLANITSNVLRTSPYPIILHTRRGVTDNRYNHFVLFLGMRDGEAQVLDPAEPSRLVPMHELISVCDGLGLAVSPNPISAEVMYAPQRAQFLKWATVLIIIGLFIKWVQRRFSVVVGSSAIRSKPLNVLIGGTQFAAMLILATFFGTIVNFWSDEGTLAHAESTDMVRAEHISVVLRPLNSKDMRSTVAEGKSIIVDARLAADYERGHIPGAISIPIGTSRQLRKQILARIGVGAPIVIYCQSVTCAFSDEVGRDLAADGYSDLSIYRDGWQGWQDSK